jgi:hypothetical protein
MEIFTVLDPQKSTVRLIEVSDAFPETGSALPVTFGKTEEFPYRSSVIILTRNEWEKLKAGKLQAPAGWNLAEARKVWPRV